VACIVVMSVSQLNVNSAVGLRCGGFGVFDPRWEHAERRVELLCGSEVDLGVVLLRDVHGMRLWRRPR